MSYLKRKISPFIAFAIITTLLLPVLSCGKTPGDSEQIASPELIDSHCSEMIGNPRVEKISPHVWAAMGHDLANTILVHTERGNIIIDAGMSPARAAEMKKALRAAAPRGPVLAIVYTHSHIDHIGGASVWAEKNTEIWATEKFTAHLFKQYSLFSPIETIRGRRQFGDNVPLKDLPCNGIGRRADVRAALKSGVLLPTRTFSGRHTLKFGGITMDLVEAHGETHDQLFVWIPGDRTIVAGDNFYHAFPNLYTIRGTSPRPVDDWIRSIDAMRGCRAEHLVPCHTRAVHGAREINESLTNYRDAIQWVRDAVVRGANRGLDPDTLSETIRLPEHLLRHHYNKELYGHVAWSVRAIYDNNLGWFDGRPEHLYPPDTGETARREIELMGGADRVMGLAREALDKGDNRWAVHLLAKVERSGVASEGPLKELRIRAYEQLAGEQYNLNGRGYLLESARELREGTPEYPAPEYSPKMVSRIPLELIFSQMEVRLDPTRAMDVHESVRFVFTDDPRRFTVTVRRGIAEAVTGQPLPNTPEPVAVVTVDSETWRRLALKITGPAAALASGKMKVSGSWTGFLAFMRRFAM